MPGLSGSGRSAWVAPAAAAVLVLLAAAAVGFFAPSGSSSRPGALVGIHKIRHVVVVMQENRSFDSLFRDVPGCGRDPVRVVCLPDPANGGCVRPFHDRHDMDAGGPHGASEASADIDGGKMDGFVAQQEDAKDTCHDGSTLACASVSVCS